ncbi:hypothetical protein H8Z76_12840 [Roseburia sp. BX0805]|uniref:Transposase, YhgA-like n=1 Tax=Roseburia yibonii TaxID=2763063 RepID=A0ABR7ID53_9FIRM|nr:hypothetical protein [Roseburia yibonii]MBC5754872.1 hypothetical protein [Roseburia yibonii]
MDKTKETGNQVYRSYKDRLFRMVFREKKELLGLYNAVNGTSYTDPEALTVVTLENAIYMNMKNDLAVVMDFYMDLYEHQSTYNPNIPLRNLHYVAKELRSWSGGRTIYGRQLVKIPTPRFFVFYNGRDMQPERQVLKLSDAFINPEEDPALELKVVMLNINLGRNKELMEQCHTLLEYAQFVDRLRTCEKSMGREEAVKHTVDTCIREGILRDFLLKYREEAIEMCIFEYDEEETLRQLGQQSYEEGVAAGIEQGRTEGVTVGIERGREEGRLVGEEQLLFRLICTKLKKGKTPEVIAEELEEDVSRVEQICEKAKSFAPEYDWKKVYEQMKQL